MYKCPICGNILVSELLRIKSGAVISKPSQQNIYAPLLICPNEVNHGIDQTCSNCGRTVDYPDQHRNFIKGQIGSLIWTCIRGDSY